MIEQIFTFVLGVSVVPFIWGVTVVFKTSRNLKSVQQELPKIYKSINNLDAELHRRINQEIHRADKLHGESIKHTDSRVDKLESKLDARFNDVFSYDESKRFEIDELRQRVNNTVELINDIACLNIKK